MGFIYAEILLINSDDIGHAKRHIIGEEEIRQVKINMLVDCGAYTMCINENIQEILGLSVIDKKRYSLAAGISSELNMVGPVCVKFQNTIITCDAIVLPGDSEPLLGAIPLEEMDVLIHPNKQELIFLAGHPGLYRI